MSSFHRPNPREDATSMVEASEAIRGMAAAAPHLSWLQAFASSVDVAASSAVDDEFDSHLPSHNA